MTREFELRIVGHPAGDGELLAGDAVGLITAFKELAYRLTRHAADRAGLGRTDAVLERLAQVRVALRGGGTRLVFTLGDPDALDIDPNARVVDDLLWKVLRGMANNRRPQGITDSVAEPVDMLVVALAKAGHGVEIVAPRRAPLELRTYALDRRPWQRRSAPVTQAARAGVLEMVDLHTGRFRLRDEDGDPVDLIEVSNAEEAAGLVGRYVEAAGVLAVGGATRHDRMEQPVVRLTTREQVQPPVRVLPGQTTFDEVFAAEWAPAPSASGDSLFDL